MKRLLIPLAAALVVGCATTPPADCGCNPCACKPCECKPSACKSGACKPCECAPNTLSAAEKAEGWQLLWDGSTTANWVGEKEGFKAFPKKGWEMKDGVLTVLPRARITPEGKWEKLPDDQCRGGGGSIVTVKKYRDFMFKCDFRLTKAANSGIKYFYDEKINGGTTLEYQILDGAHPDATKGVDGNRRVASLYDMMPSHADKLLKPLGEWNTAMVVSKGTHVEHWLNGVKVLEFERGGKAFMDAFAKSKYASPKINQNGRWGLTPEGRIHIQDHSDSTVSYRNIKIREL